MSSCLYVIEVSSTEVSEAREPRRFMELGPCIVSTLSSLSNREDEDLKIMGYRCPWSMGIGSKIPLSTEIKT